MYTRIIRTQMENNLEFSPQIILNNTNQRKCTGLTKIKTPPGLRSLQTKVKLIRLQEC